MLTAEQDELTCFYRVPTHLPGSLSITQYKMPPAEAAAYAPSVMVHLGKMSKVNLDKTIWVQTHSGVFQRRKFLNKQESAVIIFWMPKPWKSAHFVTDLLHNRCSIVSRQNSLAEKLNRLIGPLASTVWITPSNQTWLCLSRIWIRCWSFSPEFFRFKNYFIVT